MTGDGNMETIQSCSEIVAKAKNIVVLTGAGISTESGIRDFRSRTGIYNHAPEYILSMDYFHEHPMAFYEFAFSNLYHPKALPNKGHRILAKWEQEGRIDCIITQNIDGLHQKAGSKNVIEFHGTMKTATCQNCGQKYTIDDLLLRKQTEEKFFVCRECEADRDLFHLIKPDVVLFGDAGEWFTPEGFEKILNRIAEADCLLILGTSLRVTPFSAFPQYKNKNIPMIIINKGDTPYDYDNDTYVIQHSIGRCLSEIDDYLKN